MTTEEYSVIAENPQSTVVAHYERPDTDEVREGYQSEAELEEDLIKRLQRQGYEYVQLFVISNGTHTKYYSNTTREGHIREQSKTAQKHRVKASNSYEFTSYWADGTNKVLNDLTDFTATFFSRHTLLSVLTRYCVFTEQETLMAMRPYQIAATERLLNQIEKAHNARLCGKRNAGGYIWHTTGSGKTLTSFKAAQLATALAYVDKVVFVVDRKDLDYQTMREYDRFEKGAANGNTSTAILARQMEDSRSRIIITTIQKLSTYVKKNERSDVFVSRLHTYTIVDAIRDKNVLPFRIAYIRTMKDKTEIKNISEVVTARGKNVQEVMQKTRLAGFNSIMAVQSIEYAKLYYNEFKQMFDSSPDLRDKRELITNFIASLTADSNVDKDWRDYVNASKRMEYEVIIDEEQLRHEEAIDFIETAFQRGYVPEVGLELNDIMPPIDPFDPTANREGKLQTVLGRIKAFFSKFFGVANGEFK